ncbi:MAG: tRNA (adenosine(37)-N6)-threonylcarbamoyltransferase complex ATPase subunit type 1 TsaE [Gammaproteobacteria bacterium]
MPEVQVEFSLRSEADTEQLGRRLARELRPAMVVFLRGELGAGKTTLVRGVLRALGVSGAVKSPTYTLVELYRTPAFAVHHFDLYRLRDPHELEEMGVRDYLSRDAVVLVEWPERAAPLLTDCDLDVQLRATLDGHARLARLLAASDSGRNILQSLRAEHIGLQMAENS